MGCIARLLIDVYIGPTDTFIQDAGSNFASPEFRQFATSMSISTKEVPVVAHQSVGTVKRYHAPLNRAYTIIRAELKGKEIDKHMMLQIAVKAANDTAGPNGLVSTLLVFGSYPRLADLDQPSPTVSHRAAIINLAT
ncbi:hypothetical protein K3495_g4772 [Podosphaera aphanis]|nr:hypothetical protein K3495_g4772 [Podosphaera aphanis]